jgi:hypothetical protein
MQNLERDYSIVLAVLGQVHRCHAAAAQLAVNRV